MKRFQFLLAVLLVAGLVAPTALADKLWAAISASGANQVVSVDSASYKTAQVTVWAASGSPDGTVTIYVRASPIAARRQVAQYATPTVAKTFMGAAGGVLEVELTANTVGTITVVGILK